MDCPIGLHLVKLLLVMLVVPCGLNADRRTPEADASFEVTFSKELRAEPVTGRVFVAITRKKAPEPRLQVGYLTGSPFFGADVSALRPGEPARVNPRSGWVPIPQPRFASCRRLLGASVPCRLFGISSG